VREHVDGPEMELQGHGSFGDPVLEPAQLVIDVTISSASSVPPIEQLSRAPVDAGGVDAGEPVRDRPGVGDDFPDVVGAPGDVGVVARCLGRGEGPSGKRPSGQSACASVRR
jgi:hypothetical protein